MMQRISRGTVRIIKFSWQESGLLHANGGRLERCSWIPARTRPTIRGLQGSLGVIERREKNSMMCSDRFYFVNPLRADESPSMGKRLKPLFQSQSHAFEQAAVDHIRKWVTIEDSMEIGDEGQSSRYLP